ncbi:MAG: RNA methyltransferase, partial [Acidobacteriota bacterium]|nr:RNA methyltransferase [Acidobacteriota bacterium]
MTNPEWNQPPAVHRELNEPLPLWVSGVHAVKEVLRAKPDHVDLIVLVGRHPSHRMFIAMAREHGIPYTTDEARLPEFLRRKKHAPVFARLAAFRYTNPEDLWETVRPTTIFLILDHVQDPTNLGNILRTAAGAGVQGIFIPRHRGVRVTPTVAHIASGALTYVPVARYGSLQQLIQQLQERGVWVVAADPYATEPWFALKANRPIALVLGHEGEGVTKTALQLCDQTVRI